MGRHSYELYLFHIVVLGLMREFLPRDQLRFAAKPIALVAYVTVSCGAAALAARLFGNPLNAKLRDRWL